MLVKSCYYSASTVCIDFFSLYNAEKIMSSDYWNIKSDSFVNSFIYDGFVLIY